MAAVSLSDRLVTVDLTPRIGTEIRTNVATLLSGAHAAEIREILEDRGVVVVRELRLDDDQQRVFSGTIGGLLLQGETGIVPISLDRTVTSLATEYLKGSFFWHVDGAGDDCPPRAAILSARRLSPIGGQTEFCNCYAAWEDLPDSEKKAIEKLRVVHCFELSSPRHSLMPAPAALAQRERHRDKTLPLVWTHRSGRKSLVLDCTASHIEGMSREAGRLLLDELTGWATQPRYVYRHDWKVGDMLIWDSGGTMHRDVLYDPDSGRLMIRTTILGDEPIV